MDGGREKSVSQRERLELTVTALFPAAVGLMAVPVAAAGRGAWLAPILALPVGLWLCRAWGRLGREGLSAGLRRAWGPFLGGVFSWVYLAWGLFLLAVSARRYADRLFSAGRGDGSRWLFLLVTLGLTLWLGRRRGAFARTGRLFFLATGVTLGAVLLLSVPSLRWENLLPLWTDELAGVPAGALGVLSLAGYGVYGLCLPVGDGARPRSWPWAVWSCGALSALLLAVVGAFGPALTLEMDEPLLYLLKGVGVPGAFQRGEAVLAAILALADLILLGILEHGCRSLWRAALPKWEKGGTALVVLAFLAGGLIPGREMVLFFSEGVAPLGNLVLGVVLPSVAVLTMGRQKDEPGKATSCGKKET